MGPKPKDPMESFLKKFVVLESGCWEWTASKMGNGYGKMYFNQGWTGAHRASYTLHKGLIPIGFCVLHRCDNPPCVNPEHLFLGTQLDNIADMNRKGRQYTRPLFGEANPNARLTNALVMEIVELGRAGHSNPKIASQFGVTGVRISQLLRRHGIIRGRGKRSDLAMQKLTRREGGGWRAREF